MVRYKQTYDIIWSSYSTWSTAVYRHDLRRIKLRGDLGAFRQLVLTPAGAYAQLYRMPSAVLAQGMLVIWWLSLGITKIESIIYIRYRIYLSTTYLYIYMSIYTHISIHIYILVYIYIYVWLCIGCVCVCNALYIGTEHMPEIHLV